MMDQRIFELALIGAQLEKTRINEQISELEAKLGVKAPTASDTATSNGTRRFSASARKHMAEGQRRRWEEHYRKKAAAKTAKTAKTGKTK